MALHFDGMVAENWRGRASHVHWCTEVMAGATLAIWRRRGSALHLCGHAIDGWWRTDHAKYAALSAKACRPKATWSCWHVADHFALCTLYWWRWTSHVTWCAERVGRTSGAICWGRTIALDLCWCAVDLGCRTPLTHWFAELCAKACRPSAIRGRW
jgi:hypothetical protein